MKVDLIKYTHARFNDFEFDSTTQGHSGSEKAKIQFQIIWTTKQATSIKLATTVGHFLCDLDFVNLTYNFANKNNPLDILFPTVVILFLPVVLPPKGGRWISNVFPCLKSQGCQFDPTFLFLLSCFSA